MLMIRRFFRFRQEIYPIEIAVALWDTGINISLSSSRPMVKAEQLDPEDHAVHDYHRNAKRYVFIYQAGCPKGTPTVQLEDNMSERSVS